MPPSRDSFSLALNALRSRLRQGGDPPGAPIPINLIAQDLRLSPTPVREALSRLAGEELVEKQGPAYTRPKLDGPALGELYNLRLIYLLAALSPYADRRARRGPWPAREPFSLSGLLAAEASDPARIVDMVFLEVMLGAGDLILAHAFQRAQARLAPFLALEARLLGQPVTEAFGLVAAFEAADRPALRLAVRQHHRRRIDTAPAMVRLADEKYRPDIV